ncbi:alpha/beta hydrolase [Hymenobacter setariae]|uniref:Alpha/beta hydrolase n=2 Tax=Hymenobacter setariae TaxID=2594794 RepID=A0A558BT05_9BACT|nr:alpha/beta hydrolase [Hymenobacter setariae]
MMAMRERLEPNKGRLLRGPDARADFDAVKLFTPFYPGVTYAADTVGGVAGWWCRPASPTVPDQALLFLHGGAYVLGTAEAFRTLVSQVVGRAGIECFVPDYRLAPENPFPAAVEDALAAYHGLAALGKHRIGIVGDSAGGGLSLVLTASLVAQAGAVVPRVAVVYSPWTDLALTSESMHTQAEADFLLTKAALATNAALYLQGHDAYDPQASPVYGDLAGLPPVQVHVGQAEVLLDDARRYVARAQATGTTAELHVWESLTHVFIGSAGTLVAASEALDLSTDFLCRHLA